MVITLIDISPSFVIALIVYGLSGHLDVALIAYVSGFLHETAHIVTACCFGYKVKKISFFACGFNAVFENFKNITWYKEVIISLAGPFVNLLILLVAPLLFAYSDVIARINIYLFAVNMLPVYPLDGGRIMKAFLKTELSAKKTEIISYTVSVIIGICALIIAVIYTFGDNLNIAFLIVSLYILSNISLNKQNKSYVNSDRIQKARCFVCNYDVTLGNLVYKTGISYNLIVFVTDENGDICGYITGRDVEYAAMNNDYNLPIKKFII